MMTNAAKPLSVTFDSNVFMRMLRDEERKAHPQSAELETVLQAIKNGQIRPYAPEGLATYELVRWKDRARFLIESKPSTTYRDAPPPAAYDPESGLPYVGTTEINIRTNYPLELVQSEMRSDAIKAALACGFQFIRTVRVGMLCTKDLPCVLEDNEKDFWDRLERTGAILDAIEARGAGRGYMESLAKLRALRDVRTHEMPAYIEANKLPGAIAEWMDGDAIGAHFGHRLDVFCTLDEGKSSGSWSILHKDNRAWLEKIWGVRIMSPSQLVAELAKRNGES